MFSVIFDVDICSYGQKPFANYKTLETANLSQSSWSADFLHLILSCSGKNSVEKFLDLHHRASFNTTTGSPSHKNLSSSD